ncbi:MAG: GatB/YqeY domain-containing protein [Isosphaeraceae bacterium]
MTIVERMRAQLREAMKARDAVKTGFLRYWIAQLTLATGAEVADADAIKKMRGILREAKAGPTTFSEEEIALLREWIPPTLGPEQIAAALVSVRDQIKAAPKDGMAMGIAMRALAGQQLESDDVKAAVASLRQ